MPAAIRFVSSVLPGGASTLAQRNHALAVWGRDHIAGALGIDPPAPASMPGSTASLPLPVSPVTVASPDVDPLQSSLMDCFHIEVPVFTWPERTASSRRWVRISAQAYNRFEHFVALADALAQILVSGDGALV